MARLFEQTKTKKQTKLRPLEKFCTLSPGGPRLGMIGVLGRLQMPSILAAQWKKRKEIVQYHTPGGRP